jgi:hypothetical protein
LNDSRTLLAVETLALIASKRLIGFLPFLGLPGIEALLLYVLASTISAVFKDLSRVFTFSLIDSKTQAEKLAFELASDALIRAQVDGKDLDEARSQFRATLHHLLDMRKP